jgi:hypothetical protein
VERIYFKGSLSGNDSNVKADKRTVAAVATDGSVEMETRLRVELNLTGVTPLIYPSS